MAGHQHHAADAGRGRGAARLADALDRASPASSARARHRLRARRRRAARGRAGRDREMSCASSAASARPAYLSSGATRAIATARSASASTPSPLRSLVETTACLLADQHAQAHVVALGALAIPRPRRRAPRPTATPTRTATASAASAPAARAALTSRSASASRADWSNREVGCEHGAISVWRAANSPVQMAAFSCALRNRFRDELPAAATPRQSCFASRRQSCAREGRRVTQSVNREP